MNSREVGKVGGKLMNIVPIFSSFRSIQAVFPAFYPANACSVPNDLLPMGSERSPDETLENGEDEGDDGRRAESFVAFASRLLDVP
jgi:hypothetical protein